MLDLSSFPSSLALCCRSSPPNSSVFLFDSISEFPRENIAWKRRWSKPVQVAGEARRSNSLTWKKGEEKEKGQKRSGIGENRMRRARTRRAGKSQSWEEEVECQTHGSLVLDGGIIRVAGQPYRSPLGRRDFPRLLPWEEVQGSSSVFRALKVSGIVFQERKTWSWLKADWDGWCGHYWSSSRLSEERACMLMLYFPVPEYW